MPLAALVVFIFVVALAGRKPSRGLYVLIGVAALIAAVWEYLA